MSSQRISTIHSIACIAAVLVMMGVLFSVPTAAQVAGGSLAGTITDPSGAAIPQAQIAIKNIATGVERRFTTNTDGFYTAPNLLPGDYEITVTAEGFNTETKTGINMTVGAQRTFDLVMQIGEVSHKILVTTEAPIVALSSSDISATVNATTVRELPLNGRSWTDLATLQPGVNAIKTQPAFETGADRGNRGFGQQLTISGARPQQNNYRLDGVSLNDYANGGPGSVLGGNLGVDAIQEFSVLTSNYSAEYGKTSGGVVNAITRSGTNVFHGDVYEFLRNSQLDAANFFENAGGVPRAPFKRNQFGGAIGGPIIKNRTFFFADYEGIRQAKGIPYQDFVPSLDARNGIYNGQPILGGVDPAVQKYLALYPKPNGGALNPNVGIFTFSGQQVINENFVTTRIDHRLSDKDSLFGTYLFDRTPYTSPDSFNNVLLGSLTSRTIVAIEETHSFTPGIVNAVRFGYNHEAVNNDQSLKAINPAAADPSLGAFSGLNAAQVLVTGLSPMSGGVGSLPTYFYRWNSFQVYDEAFVIARKHSIKFGIAVEPMRFQATGFTDPTGIWRFRDVLSFLTNSNPTKFQGGVGSLTPRNLRQAIFGAYVQDDWRWRSNLTLNLGLRYEMATVPTDIHGKLVNLRNISDATPHLGDPFFNNPTLKNFEPRIGFAWDPFGNGKTAVRGGIGLFDVLPLPYQFHLMSGANAPFFEYTSINSPASLSGQLTPFKFFSVPSSDILANTLRSAYIESNPRRNYVAQWNFNVQYQLSKNLAAMIAYVGSRGMHQPFRVDEANLVMPTKTSYGYLWPQVDVNGNLVTPQCTADPTQCSPPLTINPNYGSVRGMFYQGESYFNALELQVSKRMSRGFQFQGTYTWGKSIDTSSATVAGDTFGNSISSLNYFDTKLTRGLSDFNVGRTLVLNATWEVPSPKSFSGPARWLADGWQLGLIFMASDGVPFTPTFGTGSDPMNTLSSDDFAYPNRLTGPGCQTLTHPGNPNNYIKTECFAVPTAPNLAFWAANCDAQPPSVGGPLPSYVSPLACFNLRGNAGRNILIGPGITNLDFSVFKNNRIPRISETFNVQFRAEIFNTLNHPNFAPPTPGDGTTDIFDGTGLSLSPATGGTAGVLIRTTVPERQIQFAIKVIF
jgi:Carboxypeptidase regulatory-like domain/TonB-dependent Receptor Plug Domain/TonB dependent receptor